MREMQRRAGVEITAVSLRVLITCYTGRALAHGKVLGTKPEGVFAPAIRPSLPSLHNQAVQVISPWEHSSTLCSDCAGNVSVRKVLEEPAPRGTCPCCVAVSCWQGGCCGGAPAALGFCSSLTKRKAGCPPGATQPGRNTLVWTVVLVGGCAAACCLRTVTGQSLLLCSLPLYSSMLGGSNEREGRVLTATGLFLR